MCNSAQKEGFFAWKVTEDKPLDVIQYGEAASGCPLFWARLPTMPCDPTGSPELLMHALISLVANYVSNRGFLKVYPGSYRSRTPPSQTFRAYIWLNLRIFRIFRQNTSFLMYSFVCLGFQKRLLMPLNLHSQPQVHNILKLCRHLGTETYGRL